MEEDLRPFGFFLFFSVFLLFLLLFFLLFLLFRFLLLIAVVQRLLLIRAHFHFLEFALFLANFCLHPFFVQLVFFYELFQVFYAEINLFRL